MKRYTKPIHLQELTPHRRADSSLALINVVFLLLLFLLVSGTLRPPLPQDFDWAETTQNDGASDIRSGLVLTRNGIIWAGGKLLDESTLATFLEKSALETDRLTVQVDKHSRMDAVAALAAKARSHGVKALSLVTVEAGAP